MIANLLKAFAASVWLNDVFLKTTYGKCVVVEQSVHTYL